MRRLLISILLFCFLIPYANAQDGGNFWKQHILGGDKSAPTQLNTSIYPFLFLEKGLGATIGMETGHFQFGLIGFSVKPPEFIVSTFFGDTDGISIPQNDAVEAYMKYYLREDRKWAYVGLIGGPEWFQIEDNSTNIKETISRTYAVPVIGLRWLPYDKYFFADASFGYSLNLGSSGRRKLGNTSYTISSGGMIYFLELGARIGF